MTKIWVARSIAIILCMTAINWVTSEASELSTVEAGNLLQYRPGHILLAGLMRVHRRGNEACSEIQEDGIQAVEAMNMIIDQVNENDKILPGIKLGTIMVDTCDVDSHALQRVVIDILPLIWNVSTGPSSSATARPTLPARSLMAGVVGSASSAVSIQVANLLQVFEIPQVSYWSTSPDLSNKARYKYFFRVVPSDTNQASAMIALAKERQWNYVSVVYEDDFYGVRGFTEIKELAAKQGICIATSQAVPRNPAKKDYQDIVHKLLGKAAKAIIVFTKRNDAWELMLAAQNIGKETKDFIWIGSDGWSRQIPPTANDDLRDDTVDGTIGFQPKTGHMKDFNKYFTNITLGENKGNFRNPWFAAYISKRNGCSLSTGENGTRKCSDNESVNAAKFNHLTKIESVADSVLSFVYALDKYHKENCNGTRGLCKKITNLSGTNKLATGLYEYLKNLSFTGINGGNLKFDENQDGPAVYNILNFKASQQVPPGSHLQKWIQAGIYQYGNITWTEDLVPKVYDTDSVCSIPCVHGEAKIVGTETCCWHCQPCQYDEYVSENGTQCLKCQVGSKPNANKTACDPLPIQEMTYNSVYGIACVCVGSFGLLCTLIVTGIYIKYSDTAIVKASGKELCFFVLFGVFLTFLNFLSMTASPSIVSCVFSRLLLSIGPTCMYAGLLTKTVRVVIIFQSKNILSEKAVVFGILSCWKVCHCIDRTTSFISSCLTVAAVQRIFAVWSVKMFIRPWPQILWTLGLVLIQAIILAAWLAISNPRVEVSYLTSDTGFRACAQLVDIPILIGLIYPFLLILICTILATINRNVPTGFNETQYIGFSMYTTCVIWLAFLPIFITNPSDLAQRIMTTSICLSLSATTVLSCLFGPRCFTILFHPEENTRQSVMSSSVDKGGRPASLGNVSSQISGTRTRITNANSSNVNNNNNINSGDTESISNGVVWRNDHADKTLRPKSLCGYSNGALSAEETISPDVVKRYSLPEHVELQLTGGEDESF